MAVIDAGAGLGQPVSYRAMQKAIQKAREVGVGFVSVRNSNHHGVVAYYATMALPHDCIGLSMTNASPRSCRLLGASRPWHQSACDCRAGRQAAPLCFGHGKPAPWRSAKSKLPINLTDLFPRVGPCTRMAYPQQIRTERWTNSSATSGAGLLSLGGAGELLGGHKGYGLAIAWIFSRLYFLAHRFAVDLPQDAGRQTVAGQSRALFRRMAYRLLPAH